MRIAPLFSCSCSRTVELIRHTARLLMTHAALFASIVLAQQNVTLRVAQTTLAPGGWAQIQVFADSPTLLSSGVVAVDLDASAFGPIVGVGVFSATGDAVAFARSERTHIEIAMRSPSGSLGQLPGLPLFTLRAPVLASATGTAFVTLSMPENPPSADTVIGYPQNAWADAKGDPVQVDMYSSGLTVGEGFSVEDIIPGGVVSAGTVLKIKGQRFSPALSVTAEGLSFSSVNVVSPTLIEATLESSREITGLPFRFESAGRSLVFFPAAPSLYDPPSPARAEGRHAVLPLREWTRASIQASFGGPGPRTMVVANPASQTTAVRLFRIAVQGPLSAETIQLPPHSIRELSADGHNLFAEFSSPVRAGATQFVRVYGLTSVSSNVATDAVPPLRVSTSAVEPLVWNHQLGAAAPASRTIRLSVPEGAQGIEWEPSAAPWLSVTDTRNPNYVDLVLSIVSGGLTAGEYRATISYRPIPASALEGLPVETSQLTVILKVSPQPTLVVEPTFGQPTGDTQLSPVSLTLSSNGTPISFTASVSTDAGGNWLSVDKSSGTTPATIAIQANSSGLGGGYYDGFVTVRGPINEIKIPVTLRLFPLPPTPPLLNSTEATFVREVGIPGGSNDDYLVSVATPTSGDYTWKATTEDAGDWLKVRQVGLTGLELKALSESLPAGTYRGTVVVSRAGLSSTIAVTLLVIPKPDTAPAVTPSALTFTVPYGEVSAKQRLTVDTPRFQALHGPGVTLYRPEGQTITAFVMAGDPGTYHSRITVRNSGGATEVPVTIHVLPTPAKPPVLSSITNGATQRSGPIAPGEIITLRGIGVGPQPTGPRLNDQGRIETTAPNESRVLIDGIAAPILYASVGQWNVVAPYELEGRASATVQVFAGAASSKTWTVPVAPAAPGIFTIGSTGIGRGAVLNQDNTVNSAANPAPAGTILQIFATGAGELNPAGVTGSVSSATGATKLPVKVKLGGFDPDVVYAGPAPGLASGVVQVNVVAPRIALGPATLPLSIVVNGVESPTGVLVSVR